MSQIHLVCPHCMAVNRIPASRLGENPRCGACKKALYTGAPVELDSGRFSKFIERHDIAVVVDFWAPWCGPCKMMAPAFAQAATRLEPHVRLAKVNTERESSLAADYRIQSIPTLMLFRGGREVARQPGAMGEADIVHWVHRFMD